MYLCSCAWRRRFKQLESLYPCRRSAIRQRAYSALASCANKSPVPTPCRNRRPPRGSVSRSHSSRPCAIGRLATSCQWPSSDPRQQPALVHARRSPLRVRAGASARLPKPDIAIALSSRVGGRAATPRSADAHPSRAFPSKPSELGIAPWAPRRDRGVVGLHVGHAAGCHTRCCGEHVGPFEAYIRCAELLLAAFL